MSAGNDIVALAATDSERTLRYRFFSRIISQTEKQQYDSLPAGAGLSFSAFVWLTWSIKESVYKYCSRSDRHLVFVPLKIVVERLTATGCDGMFVALARYGDALLYSRSWLRPQFIATVVSDEPGFDRIRHGVHETGGADQASQSASAREMALKSLSRDYPGAALRILREPGYPPLVYDGDRQLDLPLSLAHHDRYVAYAYRLPDAE